MAGTSFGPGCFRFGLVFASTGLFLLSLLVFSGHGYTIFGFEMVMIFGDGFTGFASGLAWFLL